MVRLVDGTSVRYSRDDAGFDRIATVDIETTHYDPARGETVSVGLGVHDRGTPGSEATYEMLHRDENGEVELIDRAYRRLDELGADGLVSYNGRKFDFEFLTDRLRIAGGETRDAALNAPEMHVDLYEDRKREADRRGKKWPSLEECLDAYGWDPATTLWNGAKVTGRRFGDELGPAYLEAVSADDDDRRAALVEAIEHYLVTDLEANLALYYGDIGVRFEPVHLGSTATFESQ